MRSSLWAGILLSVQAKLRLLNLQLNYTGNCQKIPSAGYIYNIKSTHSLSKLLCCFIIHLMSREIDRPSSQSTIGAEDVADLMRLRGSFRWSSVGSQDVRALLEQLATELGKPASMLNQHDLTRRPAAFLGGRNFAGLYNYAAKAPERTTRDRVSFLLESAGITMVTDDVIQVMRGRGEVVWDRVPGPVLGEILHKAAAEAQKPASMINNVDLVQPKDFLEGNRLAGLYAYGSVAGRRERKKAIHFLLERAKVAATKDDAIACIRAKQKVFWERMSWDEIGELLKEASIELGKPVAMLSGEDLLRGLQFLDNNSLRSLRGHSLVAQRPKDKSAIAFLLENTGLAITADDVAASIRSDKQVVWSTIPKEAVLALLERAADEIGVPVSMLGSWDFMTPLQSLHGKTLSGLYSHALTYSDRGEKDPISHLLDKVGVSIKAEDVAQRISADRRVYWDRVPMPEVARLLEQAAAELGISAVDFRQPDFAAKLTQLNQHSLAGLHGYFFYHSDRGEKDTIGFMFERIGIEIKAEDVVREIRAGRQVYWKRVPEAEVKKLLEMVSLEVDIPAVLMGADYLTRTSLKLLGGHTLSGLYSNAIKNPDKKLEESTMGFIRRKYGILPSQDTLTRTARGQRAHYRQNELYLSYSRFLTIAKPYQIDSVDQLRPWIQDIVRLYKNPSFGITPEEVEGDIMLALLPHLPIQRPAETAGDLLNKVSQHMEQAARERSSAYYREVSLSTPIGEDTTLESVLRSKEAVPIAGRPEFSEIWQKRLEGLNELHQRLVLAIAVDGRSFDDMEKELGLDTDTLQEHYDDALILLRGIDLQGEP